MTGKYEFDDLSNDLMHDFNWRQAELKTFGKMIEDVSEPENAVLARAGVCLVYAHWEGFVKASAQKYLKYVSNCSLTFGDVRAELLLFPSEDIFRKFQGGMKPPSEMLKILNNILDMPYQPAKTLFTYPIDTKSNLRSKVFSEICFRLGLDDTKYRESYSFIDRIVCDRRNYVAHGQSEAVDFSQFTDMTNRILVLMEWFRSDIEDAAKLSSYRR